MVTDCYAVPPVNGKLDITVDVPGSKSITNRALLIACQCDTPVTLTNVLFSDDSRHFLDCLARLGFSLAIDEAQQTVQISGCAGAMPNRQADLYVGSAGTAARFITAMLASRPGEFLVEASPQMMKRPMKPLLDALTALGTTFEFLGNPDSLPYRIHGTKWHGGQVSMQADKSSQFLSALLMSGPQSTTDLEIVLEGELAAKPYVDMTMAMMADFGVQVAHQNYRRFVVPGGQRYHAPGASYAIEPDISNACYFWAMATLTGGSTLVKGVRLDSLQGDIRFLRVLEQLGSTVEERDGGVAVQGPADGHFPGVTVDLGDTPDQTVTLAALAPFADSPTIINNVALIKYHETDRLQAIVNELTRLGIRAEETSDGLIIYPGVPQPAELETYDDHRMAMGLSLIGLRTPGVRIKNPACTAKTFANYFAVFAKAVVGATTP